MRGEETHQPPFAELTRAVHGGDGAVQRLTLHQHGTHPGRRVTGPEPVPDLESYAGLYFARSWSSYTVTVEGGALLLRQRRFGTVRLTHARGDEFTGRFPVATVAFERDAAGTGFRAGNGRARDIHFVRRD